MKQQALTMSQFLWVRSLMWLDWVLLFKVCHKAAVKVLAGIVFSSEGLTWKDPIPSSLVILGRIQASQTVRLRASVPYRHWPGASYNSLRCRSLHKAADFPQSDRTWVWERGRMKVTIFLWRSQKWHPIICAIFCLLAVSHEGPAYTQGEGVIQGYKYEGVGITRDHPGSCLTVFS